MKKPLLFLLLSFTLPLDAQKTDSLRVFQLGEVVVTGISSDSSTLSSHVIEKFNRTDLSNSLGLLPGVTLANVDMGRFTTADLALCGREAPAADGRREARRHRFPSYAHRLDLCYQRRIFRSPHRKP